MLDSLARYEPKKELLRSERRDYPYRIHFLCGHAVRIRWFGDACHR
jgi:hypothetical protein